MSSIDQRIVGMQFQNSQFEKGIQTSMGSIAGLKKSLDFSKQTESFSNIERASNKVNLNHLISSLDTISSRFTNLGIVATTALQNITNSAIAAGKSFIAQFTTDPITKGFEEYETKMGAIQTILTNTASKGTTIQDVTKSLDELNEYADKTIYNFAEMTKNVGTFTAAGLDLDTSTMAIKGIANLAAGSGSTAVQASTAMYQLSQALAAGKLTLMDWNSVVNAGMGGELFKNALENTAKSMGKARDMSVSFRESLQDGWITTDVLTKTLQGFADNELLVKAATEVKTFTQLIDTLKESAQSGWAKTWELIIGGKEEAAATLTKVNDIIGSIINTSAEARNKVLEFWKENGGRDALINGISNAFNGLLSVLKPIGDAFRQIFPAITGQQLVDFTKGFENFTSKLKIGEETSKNLHRTFAGLFAIIDIGKQFIFAAAKALSDTIKYIWPADSGFLKLTASMGDFFVGLAASTNKSDTFFKFFQSIGDALKSTWTNIKKYGSEILKTIKEIFNIDTSGIDNFAGKFKARFSPLEKVVELAKLGILGIVQLVTKNFPVLSKIVKNIGEGLGNIGAGLSEGFANTNFSKVYDLINSGLIVGIGLSLKKFIESLTGVSDKAGGFIDNFKNIFSEVGNTLQAFQAQLKANILITIAIAIGILAIALIAISTIDSKKLSASMGVMVGMITTLFTSLAVIAKVLSGAQLSGIGTSLIMMSIAINILAGAVQKLALLKPEQLGAGVVAITLLINNLIMFTNRVSKDEKSYISASIGMIGIATAITILTTAVQRLGAIKTESLVKGLLAVSTLLVGLALFGKIQAANKMGVANAVGLILLGVALNILSIAVEKLANIKVESLGKALIAIGILLLELAAFTKLTQGSGGMVATGLALMMVAQSLVVLADVLAKIGALSLETIGKGLLGIAGTLLILVLALKVITPDVILKGVGLIAISEALIVLANAVSKFGNMPLETIAIGMGTMAISLAILVAAMYGMQGGLAGAAALVVMTLALKLLVPVLQALGAMSIPSIAKALGVLVGVFVIFGIAGLALAPVVPVLLALSGAIALFGVGVLAVGAGVLLFSTALASLAVSGTAAAAATAVIITTVVNLIPYAVKKVMEGVKEILKGLIDIIPEIAILLTKILEATLQILGTFVPKIIETALKIVTSLFESLVKYYPKIMGLVLKLVLGILTTIRDNIGQIVSLALQITTNFLLGIAEGLPGVIDAAFKLIISFIDGMATAIDNNAKQLFEAVGRLIMSILKACNDFIDTILPDVDKIGGQIIDGLIKGITDNASKLWDKITGLAGGVLDKAKDALGIHSPSKEFYEIGDNVAQGMANGISKNEKKAIKAAEQMSKKTYEESKEWIDDRKYYNELTLEDELEAYEYLSSRYAEGTNERRQADKEVYRLKKELIQREIDDKKKAYDNSVKWINDEKYYNRLSLEDELAAWERIQSRYEMGEEERMNAEKEIYRLKKEIAQKEIDDKKKVHDNSMKWIDEQKYYSRLSLEDELAAWTRVQSRYLEGTEERIQADREIYRINKELVAKRVEDEDKRFNKLKSLLDENKYYNNSSLQDEFNFWTNIQAKYKKGTKEREEADRELYRVKKEIYNKEFSDFKSMLDDKKYYNKLTISEELAAWQYAQNKYKEGTEERKQADREVYRLQQDIQKLSEDLENKKKELHKKNNDDLLKADEEYTNKVMDLNKKMNDEVKKLQDDYNNALTQRTNALYTSFGLFDKITKSEEKINGADLIVNLKDQTDALKDWKKNIKLLVAKGVSADLIKELEAMGPKSSEQIRALTELSEPELDYYVQLWQEKHQEAKMQAVNELEDLRITNEAKIKEIQLNTNVELESLKSTWLAKLSSINHETSVQLTNLQNEFNTKIGSTKIDTETKVNEMKTTVETGIKDMVKNVKTAITEQNWINIGQYIVDGMRQGILNKAAELAYVASRVAATAYTAAKNTLGIRSPSRKFMELGEYSIQGFINGINSMKAILQSEIANALDISSDPVIKPVLDLSAISNSGIKGILNNGINVGLGITPSFATNGQNGSVNSGITFVQNNYSPKELSRIDIYRQTNNQLNKLKGLIK